MFFINVSFTEQAINNVSGFSPFRTGVFEGNEPVSEYECEIIAIAHRHNDVEDKLVGAPVGMRFAKEEIETALHFQEQYYDTEIEVIK